MRKQFISKIKQYVSSRLSLSEVFSYSTLLFGFGPLFLVLLFLVSLRYQSFKSETKELNDFLLDSRKQMLKSEVDRVIDYINYSISLSDQRMKHVLRLKTNEYFQIIQNLHIKYGSRAGRETIGAMLGNIFNTEKKAGYQENDFAIISMGGQIVLKSDKSPFNQGNVASDSLFKRMKFFLKTNNSGFVNYVYSDQTGVNVDKIAYCRIFKPLGWIVVTFCNTEDYQSILKKEILERISLIRFGNQNYVNVVTYDGMVMMNPVKTAHIGTNQWELTDNTGKKFIQEWRKQVQLGGNGFVTYYWTDINDERIVEKLSYVKAFEPWKWMISSSFVLEEIDGQLKVHKQFLVKRVIRDLLLVGILVVVLFIVLWFSAKKLSIKIKKSVVEFETFFQKASSQSGQIDLNNVSFNDFKSLGLMANQMIDVRLQVEQAYREEKIFFEKLFENSPEAIIMTDPDGNVMQVNKEFERLFGYIREDLLGDDVERLISPPDIYHESRLKFYRLIEGGNSGYESVRKTKNGTVLFVFVLGAPIVVEGALMAVFLIYRDITDIKMNERNLIVAKEKAEEASMLKDAFLSNLSHEIRTPMNAILGFSSLLKVPSIGTEERNEYINLISRSGNQLLRLIEDMIDISKIEAKQLKTFPRNFDVVSELYQIRDSLIQEKKTVNKEHLKLILTIPSGFDSLMVYTDQSRFMQIFSHLVGNAIKFTEKGFVEFGFCFTARKTVQFFVKDTGIGFNHMFKDVIFERFRQVNESSTRLYGGTGIGLALSKSLVELLGGEIFVESEQSHGSLFYFEFQLEKILAPEELETTKMSCTTYPDLKGKHILIAEDSDYCYEYIQKLLNYTGVTVTRVKNGKEALDYMGLSPAIDLVFIDIQMPEMDGYKITPYIKKSDPFVPVVALTSFSNEDEQNHCLAVGCTDCIAKPVTEKNLFSVLNRLIR